MEIKHFRLSDLREYPGNYNRHPDHQIEALRRSLDDFGQFKNVVVWNGQIIAGNGLVMAAKAAGLSTVAGLDVSHLPEDDARRLLVADNALADMAEPDADALKAILDGLGDPLEIPGVTDEWLEAAGVVPGAKGNAPGHAGQAAPPAPGNSAYREQYGVIVICTGEAHQEQVYNDLIEAGYENVKVVNT